MMGVVVSDLHGDAVTDGVPRFGEISRGFRQAVDFAIDSRANFFACAGDVSDPGAKSYRALAMCIEGAQDLQRAGIPSFWVTGNHDVLDDGSGTSILLPIQAAGHYVAAEPSLHIGKGFVLLFLPYPPFEAELDEWRGKIEKAVTTAAKVEEGFGHPIIVIGHLAIPEAEKGSESRDYARGRDVFWPTDLLRERLPNALLVGGHYHHAQNVGGIWVVGSMARLRHDEEENLPGFMIVKSRNGKPAQVSR